MELLSGLWGWEGGCVVGGVGVGVGVGCVVFGDRFEDSSFEFFSFIGEFSVSEAEKEFV